MIENSIFNDEGLAAKELPLYAVSVTLMKLCSVMKRENNLDQNNMPLLAITHYYSNLQDNIV